MTTPTFYIFSGLPGSGKSTLAKGLAKAIGAVYLRIDTIEQALRDLCNFKVEGEGYRLSYRIAKDNLLTGNNVVADSCNPIELTRVEFEEIANRRIRLGLLLAEVGRKNNIQVAQEDINKAMMEQARQYPGQERQFFEFIQQNAAAQQQLRAPLFEDKVVDFVFEMSTVTEKEVSKDDLQAAVDALDEE